MVLSTDSGSTCCVYTCTLVFSQFVCIVPCCTALMLTDIVIHSISLCFCYSVAQQGTKNVPPGTNMNDLWQRVYREIRTTSPDTLISSYRGDVCASTGSLYMNNGPPPNSTNNIATCSKPDELGQYFHPTEMHGITTRRVQTAIQMKCQPTGFGILGSALKT